MSEGFKTKCPECKKEVEIKEVWCCLRVVCNHDCATGDCPNCQAKIKVKING